MFSQPARWILTLTVLFATLSSCTHGPTPISRELPESSGVPVGARSPSASPRSLFDWPVDSARLTRGFLPHKRRPHLGLDLASPKGTPILAARSGTVIYRGRDFRGFGKMVMVESGDGWATLYAHLDKYMVEEGQRVTIGQMVGAMGRTGRATGVHLHFEIRRDRRPVDPLSYLPGGRRVARHTLDHDIDYDAL